MNRISAWREAARRRRDDADVRVHPDAGNLPSHHARPKAVRGGRQALAQIDAELAPVDAAAAGPVYSPATVRWAHAQIERNIGEAADLHTRAMECLELEREVLERNVDLRAFLAAGNPAEFTPGTHQAPAAAVEEGQSAERRPVQKGTVGECYTCGAWAGTRWQFNWHAQRMVPTCPTCAPTAPMTEEQAAHTPRPALPAAGPGTGPQPGDTLVDIASFDARPPFLLNGDVEDTLSDLRALDGVR